MLSCGTDAFPQAKRAATQDGLTAKTSALGVVSSFSALHASSVEATGPHTHCTFDSGLVVEALVQEAHRYKYTNCYKLLSFCL